jgi:hypothetical protein
LAKNEARGKSAGSEAEVRPEVDDRGPARRDAGMIRQRCRGAGAEERVDVAWAWLRVDREAGRREMGMRRADGLPRCAR